jgi:hypothetical protein
MTPTQLLNSWKTIKFQTGLKPKTSELNTRHLQTLLDIKVKNTNRFFNPYKILIAQNWEEKKQIAMCLGN